MKERKKERKKGSGGGGGQGATEGVHPDTPRIEGDFSLKKKYLPPFFILA